MVPERKITGWLKILGGLIALGFVFSAFIDSGTVPQSANNTIAPTTVVPVQEKPEKKIQIESVKTDPADWALPGNPIPKEETLDKPTNTLVSPTSPTSNNLSNDNYYTNVNGNRVHSPAKSLDGGIPAGASARCRDGTYSFSQNRRGTCSHHGGVASWL